MSVLSAEPLQMNLTRIELNAQVKEIREQLLQLQNYATTEFGERLVQIDAALSEPHDSTYFGIIRRIENLLDVRDSALTDINRLFKEVEDRYATNGNRINSFVMPVARQVKKKS